MGEIGLLLVAVAVALTVTVVSPSASRSDPLFTPAIIGGQPPGAVEYWRAGTATSPSPWPSNPPAAACCSS